MDCDHTTKWTFVDWDEEEEEEEDDEVSVNLGVYSIEFSSILRRTDLAMGSSIARVEAARR